MMIVTATKIEQEKVVLAAYIAARKAGCASAECYKAGVAAWRRLHPDQAAAYAAKRAVRIILNVVQNDLTRVDEWGPVGRR